jgi:hypothetical protein
LKMLIDERTEFLDATPLNTGAAGTYLLGDVIDLGTVASGDLGNGQPMYLVITVDTAATSAGAATGNFILVSDAQAAIATDGSATVHAQTGAQALSGLTTSNRFVIPLPLQGPVYERYLGILQTTGTAAFTAGRLNAFLTLAPAGWTAYPDAVN